MSIDAKYVEIRDRATNVPALAVRIVGDDSPIARRAGFGNMPCIELVHLTRDEAHYDAYSWTNRTMNTAHSWLVDHWDEHKDGDVVDVEFILGETTVKKINEHLACETCWGKGYHSVKDELPTICPTCHGTRMR